MLDLHTFSMLSRRIFRQLTDSVLLETNLVTKPLCLSARCASCSPRSRANAPHARHASSSSTRWKTRQGNDFFAREARVQGLKSRAAFKLLEVVKTLPREATMLMYCS
jgi:21S rRNA (uridine2791-2'-O)-methyltransferase